MTYFSKLRTHCFSCIWQKIVTAFTHQQDDDMWIYLYALMFVDLFEYLFFWKRILEYLIVKLLLHILFKFDIDIWLNDFMNWLCRIYWMIDELIRSLKNGLWFLNSQRLNLKLFFIFRFFNFFCIISIIFVSSGLLFRFRLRVLREFDLNEGSAGVDTKLRRH